MEHLSGHITAFGCLEKGQLQSCVRSEEAHSTSLRAELELCIWILPLLLGSPTHPHPTPPPVVNHGRERGRSLRSKAIAITEQLSTRGAPLRFTTSQLCVKPTAKRKLAEHLYLGWYTASCWMYAMVHSHPAALTRPTLALDGSGVECEEQAAYLERWQLRRAPEGDTNTTAYSPTYREPFYH